MHRTLTPALSRQRERGRVRRRLREAAPVAMAERGALPLPTGERAGVRGLSTQSAGTR